MDAEYIIMLICGLPLAIGLGCMIGAVQSFIRIGIPGHGWQDVGMPRRRKDG